MKVANVIHVLEAPLRIIEYDSIPLYSGVTYDSLEDILTDMVLLSKEVVKITTTDYGSDANILTIFVR